MTHTTPKPANDTLDLELLAANILAGNFDMLPKVEFEYFGKADWTEAAQEWADGDGTGTLAWYVRWEVAHSDWIAAGSPDLDDPSYMMKVPRGLAHTVRVAGGV